MRRKLAPIADAAKRRAAFMRKKREFFKKLDEYRTLCGVEAGAVIYGPYDDDQGVGPVVLPSAEGFQEVVSKFMELPEPKRVKYMMDHASFLEDRIRKGEERVRLLRCENRETKLHQFMFDCLEGKKKVSDCAVKDLGDFSNHIGKYIYQLNTRIEHLTNVGEASSSSLGLPPSFLASFTGGQGPDHLAVEDTTMVTGPTQFYDCFQQDNMNQHESVPPGFTDLLRSQHMNLNQHEPVEHHTSINFNGQTQHGTNGTNSHQNMDLDINQQGSFQHPNPISFNGQTQHGISDTNSNQNMESDINQQGSFMSLLMGNMNLNNQELVQHHGPSGFIDMNPNLQQPVQHHIPASFTDCIHYQSTNQNQEEPVQHHTPINFNGQTQHGTNGTNSTQNVDMDMDMDMDINQQGSFMSLLMDNMNMNNQELVQHHGSSGFTDMNLNPYLQQPVQHHVPASFSDLMNQNQEEPVQHHTPIIHQFRMGYNGEHAAHMNEDNHREPPPTTNHDLAATPHMPSITMADVFAPDIDWDF